MKAHAHPAALRTPFWTPGVLVMFAFIATAFLFIVARYTGGLKAVTHLSDAYPWGLWIGIDVATGVALAAGGFTSAALAHIFGRHAYESVTRPALLTAVLGYTFVSMALVVDIGRSWTIWHPIVYHQGHSVLFEVAMCVVIYLHVLYIEFIPVVAEQYKGKVHLPGAFSVLNRPVDTILTFADKVAPAGPTKLTEPLGGLKDSRSRIYPFKLMEGRQMADAEHKTLIVPHLFGPEGYWKTFDWEKSFQLGMKSVNLPYSGKFEWVDTTMYWGLNHETMPARNALGCAQCHELLKGEKTCSRCHQDNREVDFKKLSSSGTDFTWMKDRGRDVSSLIGKTDYIDFKALGYKGDPIVTGGRFKRLPLGTASAADGSAR